MDSSRIKLIQECPLEKLQDAKYLEEELLVQLGFNDEILKEQPEIVQQNTGGLYSWQYPNQFSQLLVFLSKMQLCSYLEIGVRLGGTFMIVCEYLKMFNTPFHAVGVDLIQSEPLSDYCRQNGFEFHQVNTLSPEFQELVQKKEGGWDLVLIDGDHTLQGCYHDFMAVRDYSKNVIFHDICSLVCPGVCTTWMHVKSVYSDIYDFYEFLDQYPEVVERTEKSFLGIGISVKKTLDPPL